MLILFDFFGRFYFTYPRRYVLYWRELGDFGLPVNAKKKREL